MLIKKNEKRVTFIDWVVIDGYIWFIPKNSDVIFRAPIEGGTLEVKKTYEFCKMSEAYQYSKVIHHGSELLFIPFGDGDILVYDLQSNTVKTIEFDLSDYYEQSKNNHRRRFIEVYKVKDIAYLFGYGCPLIIQLNCNSLKYEVLSNISKSNNYNNLAFGIARIGDGLFSAFVDGSGMIRLDVETAETNFIQFDRSLDSVDGIAEHNGNIMLLGKEKNELTIFAFGIDGRCLQTTKIGTTENTLYYFEPVIIGNYVYAISMGEVKNYVMNLDSKEVNVFDKIPQDADIVSIKKIYESLYIQTSQGCFFEYDSERDDVKKAVLCYRPEDESFFYAREINSLNEQLYETGMVYESEMLGCKDFNMLILRND